MLMDRQLSVLLASLRPIQHVRLTGVLLGASFVEHLLGAELGRRWGSGSEEGKGGPRILKTLTVIGFVCLLK